MKTTFIYFLRDPINPNRGYVGKTNSPKTRLSGHFKECRNKKHYRANWIKSLASSGLKPSLEIVDEVPFEHWPQLEVAYVEFFIEQGFDLVNGTPGGDAPPSWLGRKQSPETIAKRVAACSGEKNFWFGKKFSPEHRAKISVAGLGNKRLLGKRASLETRAKMSAAQKGRKHSLEACAKISAAKLGEKNPMFGNTGEKNPFFGSRHSLIARKKMSAALKARHQRMRDEKSQKEITV